MRAGRVINRVPATAGSTALKRAELVDQTRIVEELDPNGGIPRHLGMPEGKDRRCRARIDEVNLPAPLPLSPSKRTFVIAFAMSLKCQ
jgi:hypothetical protein